jgi:hypothetical protein
MVNPLNSTNLNGATFRNRVLKKIRQFTVYQTVDKKIRFVVSRESTS